MSAITRACPAVRSAVRWPQLSRECPKTLVMAGFMRAFIAGQRGRHDRRIAHGYKVEAGLFAGDDNGLASWSSNGHPTARSGAARRLPPCPSCFWSMPSAPTRQMPRRIVGARALRSEIARRAGGPAYRSPILWLKDLAPLAGRSPTAFANGVRSGMGEAPMSHLAPHRMGRAARALRNDDKPW